MKLMSGPATREGSISLFDSGIKDAGKLGPNKTSLQFNKNEMKPLIPKKSVPSGKIGLNIGAVVRPRIDENSEENDDTKMLSKAS